MLLFYNTMTIRLYGHPLFLGSFELKSIRLGGPSSESEKTEDKQRMKRVNHIWEKITDESGAFPALVEGSKNKRGKREMRRFLYSDEEVREDRSKWHMVDPEKGKPYAEGLRLTLVNKTWKHRPPRYRRQYCRNRTSNKGKWRDLYIPYRDDHIIHHMVIRGSMEIFTKGMHPHCCGSVPGRGIKHVVKTVSHWMQNDLKCRYFVKLDIKNYFNLIDADILKEKLARKTKDKDALWAHGVIIGSAPVACPVGYYPSPWYANLYLEDLDWFVEQKLYKERRGKRIKYVRHYLRYVDDILLIGTSKTDLEKAVRAIMDYLKRYDLQIKQSWEIKKIGKHETIDDKRRMKNGTYWCDIGGYKFCKDSTVMRDGVYLSAKRLARKMSKQEYYTLHQCQSINAKLAWAEQCDSRHFIENDILPYVNIKETRRVASRVGKISEQRKRTATGS